MNGDPELLLRLLAAQALLQAGLWALASALGRALSWHFVAISHALPWLLLAPWLAGTALLAPTGALAHNVPGAPASAESSFHSSQLNDVVLQLVPWELEVRHAFAERRWPFWSDLADGGSSPWSNPQAQLFSPIAMLARAAPIQHHHLFALALAMVVAFQGCWLSARAFGARFAGALASAVGFTLGGGILAWALFPQTATMAWVTWCFAASIRLVRRPTVAAWFATVALYLCLLLSGQPEVAFGGGALATLVAFTVRRRSRFAGRALGHLMLAGTVGFALAAPVLLPFLAQVPHSQRYSLLKEETESAPQPRSWREAARLWLVPEHPEMLLGPLTPWAFGVPYVHWLDLGVEPLLGYSSYAGLVALVGLAVLLLSGAAPRRAILPLTLALVALGLLAEFRPLTWLWSHLPLLELLVPTRLVPLASFCLALVGGLGVDRLLRSRRRSTSVLIVLLVLATSWAIWPSRIVAATAALLVGVTMLSRRMPRIALAVLVTALLLDQMKWGRFLLPRGEAGLFYPVTAELAELRRLAGGAGGRVVGHDQLFFPGVPAVYGLYDPRAHNPLANQRYLEALGAAFDYAPSFDNYFGRFRHPEHPLLDFLGVRAVYSNVYLPEIPGMPRVSLPDGIYFLALNEDPLPRFFLPSAVERVDRARCTAWLRELRDPRRVGLCSGGAEALPVEVARTGEIQITRQRPGRIEVVLPHGEATLLASSIPGPRGWRARTRGLTLETVEIDGAFLGVLVPKDVRFVELVFRPPGLAAGVALALLALSALGALALSASRLRGRTG